ncbi:MAG: hypothetical protein AAFR17_17625, partial [Pseudomonadota bacterium]
MTEASDESAAALPEREERPSSPKPEPQRRPLPKRAPRQSVFGRYRLAIFFSLFWIACLAGYGYGYFSLFETDGGVAPPPPTMNLLLFAFAAIGPLTMIWGAAIIVGRAGGISQSLQEQSEAARRLTAELADLRSTVDGQRDAIEQGLATSLLTLEKQVEASATEMAGTVALLTDDAAQVLTKRNAALEQALARTENTISTTISQRFQSVDETLSSTADRIDRHLVDQLAMLNQMLDARVSALDSTITDGQQRIAAVMEKRALGTDGYLSAATERMEGMLTQSSTRLEEALAARAAAIDTALSQQVERLDQTFEARAERIEAGFAAEIAKIDTTLLAQAERIDGALADRAEKLDQLLSDRAAGAEVILGEGAARIETALGTSSAQLDRLMSEQIGQIATRVEDLSERFEKALADNHNRMDAAFARRGENLDAQNRLLETDIPAGLLGLQKALATIQASLAANPPVSDADLARRLGKIAAESIAPERKAIGDMLARLNMVEESAQAMLGRIDRTARLNEALDR